MAPSPTIIYYANGIYGNVTEIYCKFETYYPDDEWDGITVGSLYSGDLPTKEGYVFSGWQYENNGIDMSDSLINDVISIGTSGYFSPIWEIAPPTITFNSTTGTFQSDSTTTKSVQANLDGTISLSTLVEFPIKQSYIFKGWATTENGSVVYVPYASPTITEDITLYAVWEEAENYLIREDTLVNIANAVRSKTGGTDAIALNDMATIISALGPTISASGDTLTITN